MQYKYSDMDIQPVRNMVISLRKESHDLFMTGIKTLKDALNGNIDSSSAIVAHRMLAKSDALKDVAQRLENNLPNYR